MGKKKEKGEWKRGKVKGQKGEKMEGKFWR